MSVKRLGLFLAGVAVVVGAGQMYFGHGPGTGLGIGGSSGSAPNGRASASTPGTSTVTTPTVSASTLVNIAEPSSAPIPKEALRLRIIANSDSNKDQSVKLQVRNAVVMEVAQYLKNAKSAPQARAMVEAHIPQLQALATQVVRQNGLTYAVQTEVGKVPFPTKIYGNQVYPAGIYEALRIKLGKAVGKNWWCVLFPPLCFIDITDGDAVPNTAGFPDLPPLETIQVPNTSGTMTTVQVRLASVDYGEELWHAVKHWVGA